jgi:anti-sigma B factor antagonist
MDLTATTEQANGVAVVTLAGRIVLGEESALLRETLTGLLNQGHRKILLDLAGVTYIDTSGLGTLTGGLSKARKEGGDLKLASLAPKLQDVMQITKLYTVFEIFDDRKAAMGSFGQSAGAGA